MTLFQWDLQTRHKTHLSNVGLMLGQRRRRWPNIETTLGRRLVFVWSKRTSMQVHPHKQTSFQDPLTYPPPPPYILTHSRSAIHVTAHWRHWQNAGLMLAHRLRRWPNVTLTLDERLPFSGTSE